MTQAQAVFIQTTQIQTAYQQLADLLIKHHLPSVGCIPFAVQYGGVLMCYGPNIVAIRRQGATYVDRILKGANPADLPVQLPTSFDLVVNLKTAQALGVNIPPDVAAQVTQWVQ
jgi:putative ABC transport system substrate-binding protein